MDYPNTIEMNNEDFPIINRAECETLISKALNATDFENLQCHVHHMSNVTGFLGDYFKITISVNHEGSAKTFHLFGKTMPHTTETFLEIASKTFKKEEFVYTRYFDILSCRGFGDILDFTAKLYFTRKNELFVFEDMSKKEYEAVSILAPADYDLMRMLVQTLAKFHACSILLEETETVRTGKPFRIGKEYREFVKNITFSAEEEISKINGLGMDVVADYFIEKFPDISSKLTLDEFRDKIKALKLHMFSRGMNESEKYRNVLCHGDAWPGNFLVRRDQAGKVSSSLLIDFQLIRYCPAVLDLQLLIYASTEKSFRTKYMNRLLEDYHRELSKYLEKYGYNVENIFDFGTLLRSFEDLKAVGIGSALCYAHVMLIPKRMKDKLIADAAKANRFYNENRAEFLEKEDVWSDDHYRERIKGLVEDLYEACQNAG